MSKETGVGTQTLDSSSETVELRLRQETELDTAVVKSSADELTLRLVDERNKQATEQILKLVEVMRALLAGRIETESAVNSEVSGSRPNHESMSSSGNRHDMPTEVHFNPHSRNCVHRTTLMDNLNK